MRLTDSAIRSLPSPPSGAKVTHCDTLAGFGVRVTSTGVKSFVLTYGAQRERKTLGRYPIISLAEARTIAKELLAERTLGKHRPARMKFSDALVRFLAEKEARNKASTLAITRGILNTHFKHLHAASLSDITADNISRVTDTLVARGTPSAANHALVAGRTFFKWCVRRGYLSSSPVEALERPAKQNTRERVLTDDELRAVWTAADATPGPFGIIVKLLILTGQRRSEIGNLRKEWIDCEVSADTSALGFRTQCTIPSTHTKNKRAHTFPIGSLATSLLSSLLEQSSSAQATILFPSRGSNGQSPFNGWSKSQAKLQKMLAEVSRSTRSHWTLHDLRRTYATNLQRLGVKLEVIEALLNHVSGTRAGIVGVYQTHRWHEEMREAVARYETWLRTIGISA